MSDRKVDVATPVFLHASKSIAAMWADKDVLLEKPIALDASEAFELCQVAQQTGRRLAVAYYRRFWPRFNDWASDLHDTRVSETVVYHRSFFIWSAFRPRSPTTKSKREFAAQFGRVQCKIDNQGFNTQKNRGLNLEHACSTDQDVMKALYYLLQITHLFLQMFEMGSLLRYPAKQYRCAGPLQLLGSLKNLTRWLLDFLRCFYLEPEAFEPWSGQIRIFDSS